jgi:hypothetical protein
MKIILKNNVLVFSIIFLITLIQTSCTSNFNPSDELNRIEKIIQNGEADSIADHDNEDRNFKYWIKEGKIIKLSIIDGGPECIFKEEYFFQEDGVVFANKRVELCYPAGTDYKALIIFDGAKILNEEYWLEDKKVSKSNIQNRLNELGYSIEENILKDEKTKKIKGLLNIKDFDERFNFKIPKKEDEKSQITDVDADKVSKIGEEEKILFFEQQWGPNDNQKTSYKFTIKGTKVDILYNYADHPSPIEKAQLKDGKIITEYGYSDTYVINSNSLCVPNPETGESDCFPFIRSKSTHDIEETMNPDQPGYFKGQKLKSREKIIKITYSQDQTINTTGIKLSAQSNPFKDEDDVRIFMQDKWFNNPDNGLKITYGYISSLNTYGIKIKNKHNSEFYYINVDIKTYGSYATLKGMSPEDGGNFSFRIYKDRAIVGYGQEGETTYYPN